MRRRNQGRVAVPGNVLALAVSVATDRLASRHPAVRPAVLREVVEQAAVELVATAPDAERLVLLLERRVHGRLQAMSGAPLAITAARHRR